MLIPIPKSFKKYLFTIIFFFSFFFINIWNFFLVFFKKYRWFQHKNHIWTITINFSIQITKLHRLKLNTSKILLLFNFSNVRAIFIRLLSIIHLPLFPTISDYRFHGFLLTELTVRKAFQSYVFHLSIEGAAMKKRNFANTCKATLAPFALSNYAPACVYLCSIVF